MCLYTRVKETGLYSAFEGFRLIVLTTATRGHNLISKGRLDRDHDLHQPEIEAMRFPCYLSNANALMADAINNR